jgi:signal recognition particle receptor subunit beta
VALVNYATREINAKVVYYGPGLSGKTTNIQSLYEKIRPENKGKLISLSTQGDRTLFFDFLPVELGKIKGFRTRFHLYTVPGQVFYNSTRKLVLKGTDGVVFVADSQKMMMNENVQSLENLNQNLADMGIAAADFPIVIQYNKRDLPGAATVEEMEDYLNPKGLPYFEASAVKGEGVLPTLTAMVKFILHSLKHDPEGHQINLDELSGENTDDSASREIETDAIKIRSSIHAPDISIPDEEPPEAVLEPEAAQELEPEPVLELEPEPELVMEPEPELELPPVHSPELKETGEDEEYEDLSAEDMVAEASEDDFIQELDAIIDAAPANELLAYDEPKCRTLGGSKLSFSLPVRLTTQGGMKEVTLKVSLDVELSGEGAEAITGVEILPPGPKPVDRPKEPPSLVQAKPPEQGRKLPEQGPEELPERPPESIVDKASPRVLQKTRKEKTSMFQKIFGH